MKANIKQVERPSDSAHIAAGKVSDCPIQLRAAVRINRCRWNCQPFPEKRSDIFSLEMNDNR
jgi:hypothetical protein